MSLAKSINYDLTVYSLRLLRKHLHKKSEMQSYLYHRKCHTARQAIMTAMCSEIRFQQTEKKAPIFNLINLKKLLFESIQNTYIFESVSSVISQLIDSRLTGMITVIPIITNMGVGGLKI